MDKPRAIFVESKPQENPSYARLNGHEVTLTSITGSHIVFSVSSEDQTRYAYPHELTPTNQAARILLGKLRILGHG